MSKFCASYCNTGHSHSSKARARTLPPPQRLHQHRSISTSVHRLPHFQKSSPDLESSHWIAKSRDHLDCSIFRVHHQHERKLLYSFLSTKAHSRQGHFSQRIRFNFCEFRIELFINRKRLWLVSDPEVNWFSSVFLGMLENWSSCRSRFIDHHLLLQKLVLLHVQSLNKFLYPKTTTLLLQGTQKVPWYRERNNKLRYDARTCDTMGRVFLSRCGARVNFQDHGES